MPQAPEDITFAILQGRPALAAELVEADGTWRVFTGSAPQRAAMPFVVLQPITTTPITDNDGDQDIEFVDVQIDVYATENTTARRLDRAIRDAMNEARDRTVLGTRVWQINRTVGLAFVEAPDAGSQRTVYRRLAEYSILLAQ